MSTNKRKRELIPPWNMPSDPVKAVWWFLHWLLQILVRFFWIPIVAMVIYETFINWSAGGAFNGVVGGVITLFVGLFVWAVLYSILAIANVATRVQQVVADVNRFQEQQQTFFRNPHFPFAEERPEREQNVVEGTITDLEEERNKRRRSE